MSFTRSVRSIAQLFGTCSLCLGIFPAHDVAAQGQKYGRGAEFATLEQLEGFEREPLYREFLPSAVDLSRWMPRPGNQGAQGSCVAWAVAYAARTFHYVDDNGVSPHDAKNIASPAALYNSIYGPRPNCERGANTPDAINFLKKNGVPSLASFPHNVGMSCSRQIEPRHEKDSARFKVLGGKFLYSKRKTASKINIDQVRGRLARNHAVIIGMDIPDSFDYYHGGVFNVTSEPRAGGHAMTVVGYDQRRQAFKVINSWGEDWGEGGYGWIGYESFKTYVHDAFIIETEPDPQPPPVPPRPVVSIEPEVVGFGALGRRVKTLMSEFSCAGLKGIDEDEKKISAFVRSDEDRLRALEKINDALPDFTAAIDIAPWPQCEALILFEEPLKAGNGLIVAVDGNSQDSGVYELEEGEPLVIRITTPDFPSYVYATYLQSDDNGKHEAVHLIQSTGVWKQYPPGTEIVLGDGRDGGPTFTIEGPNFGREMLVVLASASPLFSEERPILELEREYLTSFGDSVFLRNMNAVAGGRRVEAAVVPLLTKPGR